MKHDFQISLRKLSSMKQEIMSFQIDISSQASDRVQIDINEIKHTAETWTNVLLLTCCQRNGKDVVHISQKKWELSSKLNQLEFVELLTQDKKNAYGSSLQESQVMTKLD